MDIICDTHIWYYLGNGKLKLNKKFLKNNLIASYINIDEFARTPNLLDYPSDTKKAIQVMFKYSSKHAILEPPLVYLKKLADPSYKYSILDNHKNILNFTKNIANNFEIDSNQKDEYRKYCKQRHIDLEIITDLINKDAKQIKLNIKDKRNHRKVDTTFLTRQFISALVSTQTDGKGLPSDFNWEQIELFENTLKFFLAELETGSQVFKPNDWFDLFLLIYVQPNKKIMTIETKWINLIDAAGMKKYRIEIIEKTKKRCLTSYLLHCGIFSRATLRVANTNVVLR